MDLPKLVNLNSDKKLIKIVHFNFLSLFKLYYFMCTILT